MVEPGGSPVSRDARSYQGRTAGLVTRGVAAVVDGIVVLLVLLLLYATVAGVLFVLSPRAFQLPGGGLILSLTAAVALAIVYLGVSWWLNGSTYGDRLMGLRVVARQGQRLPLAAALLRAMFCVALPVGLAWVAVDAENRSLQDIVLRTAVVYDWQG